MIFKIKSLIKFSRALFFAPNKGKRGGIVRFFMRISLCNLIFLGYTQNPAMAQVISEVPSYSKGNSNEPIGLAIDNASNLWFTVARGDQIGEISPSGEVKTFALPIPEAVPIRRSVKTIAKGSDGNMWFLEKRKVGRITPAGEITEFDSGIGQGGALESIAIGPDGNVWVVGGGEIRKMSPTGASVGFRDGISGDAYLRDVVAGSDGNIWFTDQKNSYLGKITPAGLVSLYDKGMGKNAAPSVIATGSDGNVWFFEEGAGKIGKITPSGVITEYPLPEKQNNDIYIQAMASGPDGNIWFTDAHERKVGSISPIGAISTIHFVGRNPDNSRYPKKTDYLSGIVRGTGEKLWFADSGRGQFALLSLKNPLLENLSTGMSIEEISKKVHPPENMIELLKNVEIVTALGLQSRIDFYKKKNLEHFLGAKNPNIKFSEKIISSGTAKEVSANFDEFMGGAKITVQRVLDNGSSISSSLIIEASNPNSFPKFDYIENIFGSNWRRETFEVVDSVYSGPDIFHRDDKNRKSASDAYAEFFGENSLKKIKFVAISDEVKRAN